MYEKIIDFDISYELLKELREVYGGQLGSNIKRYWSTMENDLDGNSIYLVSIGDIFSLNKLVKFSRNSKGVITEILLTEDIMYAKNTYKLQRWGNELKFTPGRKRNQPDEIFDDILIWEVVEISENKKVKVKLPNRNRIYSISSHDIEFMDRKPSELELRNQEMLFKWREDILKPGRNIGDNYPVFRFRGINADKILKTPSGRLIKINIWDVVSDELKGYDLTIDEALLAMNSSLWDNWESGSEPDEDVLHSDYNHKFLEKSQTKNDEQEIYYHYMVFLDMLKAAFSAIENYKEYQKLAAKPGKGN